MHIDIWSDVVCPWCYLGSRRLDAAIRQYAEHHPGASVTRTWRAFELDPGAPADPRPMRPVIERKYGPGSFDAMTARLTALGSSEGIDYRFEDTLRVNTFDAHRLLAWAGTGAGGATRRDAGGVQHASSQDESLQDESLQDRLAEEMFRAYFTEGRNVAEHATLVELADRAGLDRDEAGDVLASGAFADQVRAEESAARERDITGVPAVVVDGRLLIPGAQEAEVFLRVMEKAGAT